ncbi:TcpQ domain-containing protein [Halodesulfovibrio aestuarii]|uniref:TcpQ domain-containing protein n=1 Tax=Halodesulfovibrio aestuarii TaxID=126333 RepID=UPI003D32B4BA
MISNLRLITLLLLALTLLSGCAARMQSPAMESWKSHNGMANIPDDALQRLAQLTAQKIVDRYPPGRTTIGLNYTKSDDFGSMFESSLRSAGFSIDSNEETDTDVLRCSYIMDNIITPETSAAEEQSVYLRLKFSDGYSVAHLYTYSPEEGFAEQGIATSTEAFFAFIGSQSAVIETGEEDGTQVWNIKKGSLKTQLKIWAKQADYQLVWKAKHDFQMQAAATFKDTFYGAVKRLFSRMNRSGNSLRVTLYQQNSVLEVRED